MLKQVQLINQFCSQEVRDVVDYYVRRNSYFAHPELILTTLLASENEEERRFAVMVIMDKIRKESNEGCSKPRKFDTSELNFQAQNFTELIDWDKVKLTEPLLSATLSTDLIVACLDNPLSVPNSWQCHSQSMERAIRKVSEACLMVVGEKKREGWIRCAEESRKVIKKPNTKADYMPLFDFSLD